MFLGISHFLNVLVFLDITLAILCCILLIRLPLRYAIKFVTIPIILFITYITVIQGENLFGLPYEKEPIGQFEFRDYRVVTQDGKKKIEIWIIQEKKSRLHIIPYTADIEQKLSKAKSELKKGIPQKGQFRGNRKLSGNSTEQNNELSIEGVRLEQLFPPKE